MRKFSKAATVLGRGDAHSVTPFGIPLIGVHPFKERIPNAWLAIRAQVDSVFGKYPIAFIQDDFVCGHDILQTPYARDDTILRCLGTQATPVRDGSYVGIDNDGYWRPTFCRSMAATVMSASSPISSPKKFFGQFLMLP